MKILESLFLRESRDLVLLVLAIGAAILQLGTYWLVTRANRLEDSTRSLFTRLAGMMMLASTALLTAVFFFPHLSNSVGVVPACTLLVVPLAIHGLVKMSQTGIERSPAYLLAAGSIVISYLLVPALFLGGVPTVVSRTVYGIAIAASLGIVLVSIVGLRRWASTPRGTLPSFRARRALNVLVLSVIITGFLFVCAPFVAYALPAEGASIFWCSSLLCASGVHVATERVGFLVEYAKVHLPEMAALNEEQLENVARATLTSAHNLLSHPGILGSQSLSASMQGITQARRAVLSELPANMTAIVQQIEAHRAIEDAFFGLLVQLHTEQVPFINYDDYQRLVVPHLRLSRELLGEEIVGVSEELMSSINDIRTAAANGESVIITGESGVEKAKFAKIIAHLRGISSDNVHLIEGNESEAAFVEGGSFNKMLDAHELSLCVLSLDTISSQLLEQLITRTTESNGHSVDLAFLTESKDRAKLLASRLIDVGKVPAIVSVGPLRQRVQDVPLQLVWEVYEGARMRYGEAVAHSLRIPTNCLLESMTYEWRGNVTELKDMVRMALMSDLTKEGVGPESVVPVRDTMLAGWLVRALRQHEGKGEMVPEIMSRFQISAATAKHIVSLAKHDGMARV